MAWIRISVVLVLALAACGDGGETLSSPGCADVIEATVVAEGGGSFRFDATIRSDDTGPEKYADAWEVRDLEGNVLGTRVLAHPHVDEQPFTRSLTGVEIPDDVGQVIIWARDSVEGFCGARVILDVYR